MKKITILTIILSLSMQSIACDKIIKANHKQEKPKHKTH